jgi:ubiquinone/menaquinone biosynthesis C-methylase UbiE
MQEQTWWNKNAETMYSTFKEWVGDDAAPSKQYASDYILKQKYNSVVDVGCGDATFYYSIKNKSENIEYTGVDSCIFFVTMNTKRNIPMINSDIRNIPALADSSVDICFSRHTFEHQPSFNIILSEMIRIGKKEACHIFFIKPDDTPESIRYSNELYHNKYSRKDIDTFLSNNTKVLKWDWNNLNDKEVSLHVILVV